jgi:tryptophan-rich sensory protein
MDWSLFLTYLAACGAAATTGAMIQPGEWYDNLKKPSWTPPRWVFPVAWTTMYLLMSLAGMRVAQTAGGGQATAFWSMQIAFNTLWTPIYFGLHRIRAAMIVMVFLWLSVAASTWTFYGVDFLAGLLFTPYLVWVTVAGALNFTTMRLNPQAAT